MKRWQNYILLLLALQAAYCSERPMVRPIGISALDVPAALRLGARMFDMRSAAAFDRGHILSASRGAGFGNRDEFAAAVSTKIFDKSQIYILYCGIESESDCLETAVQFRQEQFARTYVLEGGFEALVRNGMPIVAGEKITLSRHSE